MEDEKYKEIMKRLGLLEQHVINLIIPIQNICECLKSTSDIKHLIECLKQPILINDNPLRMILKRFEDEMQTVKKFFKSQEKIFNNPEMNEIKYIGKRLNEIEKILSKIDKEGMRKEIQLEFRCDGYELVKRTLDYHKDDPIEKSDDEHIINLLNTLEERESKIIIHRLGLLGESSKTYDKIGKMFNVTRERIRLIYAKALRKLRTNERKHLLDKIMNDKLLKEVLGDSRFT